MYFADNRFQRESSPETSCKPSIFHFQQQEKRLNNWMEKQNVEDTVYAFIPTCNEKRITKKIIRD